MTHIPAAQALRLFDATGFMNLHYGVAFNGFLTVNFEQLGAATPPDASGALTKLNESIARYLGRYGSRYRSEVAHHFIYAHERCRAHGWHMHEPFVLPTELRHPFKDWLHDWKRRHFGSAVSDRAVHFRPCYGRTLEQVAAIQAKMVLYTLKTMAPACHPDQNGQPQSVHDLLGLKRVRKSLALRVRRMAGSSQSISQTTRWKECYEFEPKLEDVLTPKRLREHRQRERDKEFKRQLLAGPDFALSHFYR